MKLPENYGTPLNPIMVRGEDIYQEYERILDRIFGGDGSYFVTATHTMFKNGKDTGAILVFVEDGDGAKHQLVFAPLYGPKALFPDYTGSDGKIKPVPKSLVAKPELKSAPKPSEKPKDKPIEKKPTVIPKKIESFESTVDPEDELFGLADSLDPSKATEIITMMNETDRMKALEELEKEAAGFERDEQDIAKKVKE